MDDIRLHICASLKVDAEMAAAIVKLLGAYANKKGMERIDQDSECTFRYVNGEERLTWII